MSKDLLFEIGVEELPSTYVADALEWLGFRAAKSLQEWRFSFAHHTVYGTPRRLALFVKDLADRQTDVDEEAMGPAVRVAYDAAGKPTKALLGFCQSKGVDPSAVRRVETAKGEYVTVSVHNAGKAALEVLPALLATLATGIPFRKSMRWTVGGADARFARPVRWLAALLDDVVVPVRAFGLEAGRHTRGHRFLAPQVLEVSHATQYVDVLRKASVLADHHERREYITNEADSLALKADGQVVADSELIEINNFLTEWPTVFAGAFKEKYLDLPREVIVTALREHQRCFALAAPGGRLLPLFLAVRNGDGRGLAQVRKGNEDVLAARLEDARFYWETDLKHSPASRVDALSKVVWIESLGTLGDKAVRLVSLGSWLAERLAPTAREHVERAALLCKTDLLSEMIGSGKEYASLEGVMGGHYARRAGEPEAVATAIGEHYRPRGSSDELPETDAGSILSLADKLDHIAGAFVSGRVPTGSEDPYGVRRAGNGVVSILVRQESRHLDLRDATMRSLAPFYSANPQLPQADIMKALKGFWFDRVSSIVGGGVENDVEAFYPDMVEAAMEARQDGKPGWVDPRDCFLRAHFLSAFRGDQRLRPLVVLFKRVDNILRAASEPLPAALDRALLVEPAERELLAALETSRERTQPLWDRRDYGKILPQLLEMEQAIHGFFESVMVNVDDTPTRLNRLRLLAEVRELFVRGWDLSKVVVEGERG